ncbi:hypothetical protein GCM10010435_36360 [Winogradskya consettensis]|uniref:Uncharacterized protein n=1 Tax=Winogradskya consettensis TaxID=113560 RepID=A0A919T1U2_9ACTN|nr:hypothetical protein Aco04nite_77890 [Actinoplanes consettensis]
MAGSGIGAFVQVGRVLDVVEGLLRASGHPDIASMERYGTLGEAWNPKDHSPKGSVTGLRITYTSTSTSTLYATSRAGEKVIAMPEVMPPPNRRAIRLPMFVVQLLDVARPDEFGSWDLIAFGDFGPTDARGAAPAGVRITGKDGSKVILQSQATGAMVGNEPEEEPFPEYVIPAGIG